MGWTNGSSSNYSRWWGYQIALFLSLAPYSELFDVSPVDAALDQHFAGELSKPGLF